jgi:diguanylate cyclase (GGDEF)-like protein
MSPFAGRKELVTSSTSSDSAAGMRDMSPRARQLFVRLMITMAAGYSFESLLLFGFWHSGFVSLQTATTFSLVFLGGWLLLFATFRRGWNLRFKDRALFLPQYLFSVVLSAAMLVAAPQISIQPLAIMSVIFVHSFMAPDRRSLVIAWTMVAAGVVVMVTLAGASMSMPSATPEGRALILLVMLGCLVRCMGFTSYVRQLQRSIREKNSALKEALARNEELLYHDELTGVANRRSVMLFLAKQRALCERAATPYCMALIDIDHFKQINDRHGHLVGDQVLVAMAGAIDQTMRQTDCFGRFGGEEFMAIFASTSMAQAEASTERIRACVEEQGWGHILPGLAITITCGVARGRAGDTAESLIRRADEALYAGKAGGRNRVLVEADLRLVSVQAQELVTAGSAATSLPS